MNNNNIVFLPKYLKDCPQNLLVNFLFIYITPEDHSSSEDKVQRSSRLGIVDNGRHFVVIQRYLSDIVSPGKQQGSVSLSGLTPGDISGISHVTGMTLTLECSLFIDADLRTAAGIVALVDV